MFELGDLARRCCAPFRTPGSLAAARVSLAELADWRAKAIAADVSLLVYGSFGGIGSAGAGRWTTSSPATRP